MVYCSHLLKKKKRKVLIPILFGSLDFQLGNPNRFPSNMAAKTTFFLYLVKRLTVTLRCAVNVTTSSFQHFP